MIDSKIILGSGYTFGNKKYQQGILIRKIKHLPCGCPVLYDEEARKQGRQVSIMPVMAPRPAGGSDIHKTMLARHDSVVQVSLKPLYDFHRVMTVRSPMDLSVEEIMGYVKERGAVSLICYYKKQFGDIADLIIAMREAFKISGYFYVNRFGEKHLQGEDDATFIATTFFDLPYVIPIFNNEKVDGVGLSVIQATRNASIHNSRLHKVFRSDMVFSNYRANLLEIDGSNINPNMSTVSAGFVDALKSYIQYDMKVTGPLSMKKGYPKAARKIKKKITNQQNPWVDENIPDLMAEPEPAPENEPTVTFNSTYYTASTTTTGWSSSD